MYKALWFRVNDTLIFVSTFIGETFQNISVTVWGNRGWHNYEIPYTVTAYKNTVNMIIRMGGVMTNWS